MSSLSSLWARAGMGEGGQSIPLSDHLQPLQKEGAWPIGAPASPTRARPPHLPGVVEAFGLDIVSLLVHHLHLGVQVPAQVLGEQGREGGRGPPSPAPQPRAPSQPLR